MKAFVTGGTGFIGSHLVRKLIARGDEVYALARSDTSAAKLEAMGAHVVRGTVTDKETMRTGIRGCDTVYHVAGWYEFGVKDQTKMALINVEGTRNVLELAYELGVPKIVHTSSIVVFGDTQGQLVNESFQQSGPFLGVYQRTKWQAHYEVAIPLIEQGAPIVIAIPGAVYGPQDHSDLAFLMQRFYRGMLPVLPGSDMMVCYVYVEDVAEGILLAADKGTIGESYILAGPALTMMEAATLWSEVTGKRPPLLGIPGKLLQPLGPVIGALERLIPLPRQFSQEMFRTLSTTYIARADKAREELGWEPRPLREGFRETFTWIAETMPPSSPPIESHKRRQLAALALGIAIVILAAWLFSREHRQTQSEVN